MKIKKTLASIVFAGAAALGFLQGCWSHSNHSKLRITWEEFNTTQRPKFLSDLENYLKKTGYKEEKFNWLIGEDYKSAKRFFEDNDGDCEDVAIFGAYCAERFFSFPPLVLDLVGEDIIREQGTAHMVALLKEKNLGKINYGFIERSTIFYPSYSSIEEIIDTINSYYKGRYKFTKYQEINLNSLKADWRTGKGNLKRAFIPIMRRENYREVKEGKDN